MFGFVFEMLFGLEFIGFGGFDVWEGLVVYCEKCFVWFGVDFDFGVGS